ncbi:hypothetical protein Y032_0788g2358 [Ancylostoma ceylanicum]|uniref:BPTI/Kunitz inhibitor domain-containing protein n=1 Tax=Ancylostoma ceylanicum TaxID=53326 RepID=A0A016WDW0_9BILA|nr:hypothetical protein Y032_0788g2358 [Ancylostoma ceylanicum]
MKLLLFALCLVSVGTLPRPPLTRVPWFCLDGADKGPCNADYKRYFFNKTSGRCENFTYGGCGGNENNFWRRRECIRSCIPMPKDRENRSVHISNKP